MLCLAFIVSSRRFLSYGNNVTNITQGYMRLGKIYRLEKKPELAWAIWTAGVDAGQREGLVRTTKYQVCLPTFRY